MPNLKRSRFNDDLDDAKVKASWDDSDEEGPGLAQKARSRDYLRPGIAATTSENMEFLDAADRTLYPAAAFALSPAPAVESESAAPAVEPEPEPEPESEPAVEPAVEVEPAIRGASVMGAVKLHLKF